MSAFEFVIFQSGMLVLITLVGVIFTFALPVPSHKHKARSGHYARLFLICMCLGQVSLALRHIGPPLWAVSGYSLFMLTSAYLLLMTVIKRYGHASQKRNCYFAIGHIAVVQLCVVVVFGYWHNEPLSFALMVSGCAIPLTMASLRIRHYLGQNNNGDRVLFTVLLAVLAIVIAAAPVYGLNFTGPSMTNTMVGFAVTLLLMMLFLLGFAVSVMHSLIHRLRSQVFRDPLTGCYNRHYFYEMAPKLASHAARSHQHLSVVVCDIDHFKSINDKYGHVVGDKALRQFARRLQGLLRSEDSLIRMGGEEFLVLSPNCALPQASLLAERLRGEVSSQPIQYQDAIFSVTASFGVVEIAPDSDIFKGIQAADDALYKAKSSGRNQVITVSAWPQGHGRY